MASTSSTPIKRYHVFPSFHGPDVRKGFLSHLHYHLKSKGVKMFKDQEIERGHTIGSELIQAIRESRVSIVVFSKNYTSSSWCLDELVEIFNCKEAFGQIVMTIFYDVDPSDIRKQKGDFGKAFQKTCEGKTKEVKQRWSEALAHVATIAGEHSLNWANEAEMIQKITTGVLNKLNVIPSIDLEGMVGLEAHLNKLESFICLGCDDVKMIGIWGPAGIGKTTIARALYKQLSSSFQLKCFMGNLDGSCKNLIGYDDYETKLCLQNQLLSKILNHKDMKVEDLDAIKVWLQDHRVLIILDDLDDLLQLEAMAKELSWFGSGSRIIVITQDKKILKAHGIQNIYHVDFPSKEEALEILCLSAFKQHSLIDGFEELANKVAEFCGNLPLGLSVVGSSLCKASKDEWEAQLSSIESSLERKIENILRVGYDRLSKNHQSLYLHIACFFNNEVVGNVISMLPEKSLDAGNGLKTLADKSLVHISINGKIRMHHLLQQLGRQIVFETSEPGKRQFLVEAEEIYNVLTNETGTDCVKGISFNMTNMGEVSTSNRAFEVLPNLRFLRIYKGTSRLHIPEDIEYLPPLRFLHWDNYPSKSLPPRFQTECLVKLHLPDSNLKKLWGGIQPLPNLKTLDLSRSDKLKEIPNLSKATNLETLRLVFCKSLVELPSSISNLHKLKKLYMNVCQKLAVIPANINLASLEDLWMSHCSRLKTFPDISSNIKTLIVRDSKINGIPPSIVGSWSRLEFLDIGSKSLKTLTHTPQSITSLDLSNSDIKKIPDCVICLPHLKTLMVNKCPKLTSIPELPPSLESLHADNCTSLKRVCCSFQNATIKLTFNNCLKLDEASRRGIIQQSLYGYICLPGNKIPSEFTHKARGNSVTISLASGTFSASLRFKACFLILPLRPYGFRGVKYSLISKGGRTDHNFNDVRLPYMSWYSDHMILVHGDLSLEENRCHVTMSEIKFNFWEHDHMIIECGVQILTEEAEGSSSSNMDNFETDSCISEVDNNEIEFKPKIEKAKTMELGVAAPKWTTATTQTETMKGCKFSQVENIKTTKHTGCWSWLRKLALKEKKMKNTE